MKKRPTFGGFITIALLALLALAADNLPASTAMAVGDGEDDGCQANILGEDSQRAQEAWDQFYALDDIYELNLAVPINVRGLHEEASRIRAQCHLSNSETGTRYSSGTSNWEDVSPFTGNFEESLTLHSNYRFHYRTGCRSRSKTGRRQPLSWYTVVFWK